MNSLSIIATGSNVIKSNCMVHYARKLYFKNKTLKDFAQNVRNVIFTAVKGS